MKTPKDFLLEVFDAATSKGTFDVPFFNRRMQAMAPGCTTALSDDERTYTVFWKGASVGLTVPTGCKVITFHAARS